jgi:uncharacterized membrane protein
MDAHLAVPGVDQILFRWIHVVAGVVWIGHLYFFNFVNSAFAPTMDGETKKKVVPQLMPRALFWFRWGAAATYVTGLYLLFKLYYHGSEPNFYSSANPAFAGLKPETMDWLRAFLATLIGFSIYDVLFKLLGKTKAGHAFAVLVWGALIVAYACYLKDYLHASPRAIYIHVGALLGTTMAANVWMRIWPAQRRIITAVRDGQAPNPADPAVAGQRSKHNTYMSVPLLLFMVSVHQGDLLSWSPLQCWLVVILIVGWLGTFALYKLVPTVKGF